MGPALTAVDLGRRGHAGPPFAKASEDTIFRSARKMVEAPGVEPGSQVNEPAATTCLSEVILSAGR